MPLPLPSLDDRRWADLVAEGRALIPRHAPAWTDHNVHDPGITLMELFAWLAEMAVYRLNRVPESHRRKFLELIGLPPRGPRPAWAFLTFTPDPGTGPFSVPAGAVFETTGDGGLPVPFTTRRDLDVAPAPLAALQVDAGDGGAPRDRTGDLLDGLPVALLGDDPQPGAAVLLGFTDPPRGAPPDGVPVALGFRFQGPGTGRDERERLRAEAETRRAACRRPLPDIVCNGNGEGEAAGEGMEPVPPHHSARVVWEVFTGGADPWTRLEAVTDGDRPAEGVAWDDTRSFTLDGVVEVHLPAAAAAIALGEVPDALIYLRGRLASGSHDAAPLLTALTPNAVAAEQAVSVFQTFPVAAGSAPADPPTPGGTARLRLGLDDEGVAQDLEFFTPEAAPDAPDVTVLAYTAPAPAAPGAITLELVGAATGTGLPLQTVILPEAPVAAGSLTLYLHSGDAWEEWRRRPDLGASGRTDRHFTLDETRGEIAFGDGEHGSVPPPGSLILAAYRATRAEAGSIAAGALRPLETPRNDLWLPALPPAVGEQLDRIGALPHPAAGGAAEEEVADAVGRALDAVHAHERLVELCREAGCRTLDDVEGGRVRALPAPGRGVNLLDVERLALAVPGTRVARARAWAGVHPAYPCLEAPGVVTVVVVPASPVGRPEPSAGLLEAVRRYLDLRRMVTTRLEVVGPDYLEVRVLARVKSRPLTDRARLAGAVRQALDAFLDPLAGGPDGRGWPFGRNVYRSEILELIDGVPGVDHVLELSLVAAGGEPRCGDLALCHTWLPTPGPHEVDVL